MIASGVSSRHQCQHSVLPGKPDFPTPACSMSKHVAATNVIQFSCSFCLAHIPWPLSMVLLLLC